MKSLPQDLRGPMIEVRRFSSRAAPEDGCTGRVVDSSPGGMNFLADRHFAENTPVYVRLKIGGAARSRIVSEGDVRTAALGRVAWSRRIADENSPLYETGIRYFL